MLWKRQEGAKELKRIIRSGMRSACVTLAEPMTDSAGVRVHLQSVAYEVLSALTELELLRVVWHAESDIVITGVSNRSGRIGLTTRAIPRRAASFPDLLGWCAPLPVRRKLVLKKTGLDVKCGVG